MRLILRSRRQSFRFLHALLLAALALVLPAAFAQVAGTGTIQGTVSDPTGAFIPKADVTLTEQSTQVSRTIHTDDSGEYVFPNIKPGTYAVSVTAPGFAGFTQKNNVLEVGSNIAVNVQLKVGGGKGESVEVSANGLALQTEDVKFKQTVDQAEITELPLNSPSRQVTGLLTISGGTNLAPGGDFTGSKFSYQTISISIAGGQGNTTLWRLDGGDNNDYMGNGNLPFPFPDALNQFSVESTVLGAQEGMHSGGLVNAVTRSGTNRFHGSAFEFIRNNMINASNFFSATKDSLHQHQFGGTFGGPIKRDKLFAFAGYQHLISHASSSSATAYVPTPAMLAGDFSACDGNGSSIPAYNSTSVIQLYDPTTGTKLAGNKYATAPTFDPASLALVKYMPTQLIDPCGKVLYSIPNNQTDNEFVTRVDWAVSGRHHFFGRYFIDGYQLPSYFSPTNIFVTTQSGNIERTQSFTAGEDWTISSQTVNSLHATLLRRSNNRGYAPNDINAATLGSNIYQAEPNGLQISAGRFTIGGGTNSVAHFNDNTIAVDDDITMVRGKHNLVWGGEFVRNQLNIFNAYESNGTFTFSSTGTYSGNGPAGGSKKGEPLLDFLAGTLSAFEQSKFQQNAMRGNIPSVYVQDTWHASRQMTAVAGIRWSPDFFPVDYFNRGSIFDYSGFLANRISTVYPGAPAGNYYYGDPGVPRQFTHNSPWQFSPNIGFSYDVNGRGTTVVRGGAEIIYDEVNFFTGQRAQQNPPYATAIANSATSTSGPLIFSAPWSRGAVTTNPFPQPVIPTPATAIFYPQSQYIVMKQDFHPAYTEQWTFSVQHQFSHGWEAQLDYIGNHTVHIPIGVALDPAIFVPGVWGPNGTGCGGVVTTGPAGKPAGAAGTACSTPNNTTQRYALTAANPAQGNQYKGGGTGSVMVGDYAWANYNGLVATLQHRLSHSFSVLTNYTWSKCLNVIDAEGDTTTVRTEKYNDLSADYGPCGSDYRNVFNTVVVARSDVQRFSHLANYALTGWEISPLVHITSGAPLNVTTGTDISLTNIGNDRPMRVAGVSPYTNNTIRRTGPNAVYLNSAAFCASTSTCMPYGTYGNLSRNAFRGPVYLQTDAQISRIFPVHEEMNLQLRLECFNVLNHPYFSNPNSTVSSSTFGQITSTTGEGPRVFQGSIKFAF